MDHFLIHGLSLWGSSFHCILYKEIEQTFLSHHQNKNAFLFLFGGTGFWVFILCSGLVYIESNENGNFRFPVLSGSPGLLPVKVKFCLLVSHTRGTYWSDYSIKLFCSHISALLEVKSSFGSWGRWASRWSAGGSKETIPVAAWSVPVYSLSPPSDLHLRPQWDMQAGKTWSAMPDVGHGLRCKTLERTLWRTLMLAAFQQITQ